MRYRLNEPDVIQETVEGETLIVHTRSGTYYNLEGSGTRVWNALLAGHTVADIVDAFASTSDDERAAIHAGLDTFVDTLVGERLVVPSDHAISNATSADRGTDESRPIFVQPELRTFTDMQELLLVDPIHDVQPDVGWPLQKDPTPDV